MKIFANLDNYLLFILIISPFIWFLNAIFGTKSDDDEPDTNPYS
jgi:hypothetical protein